MTSTITEHLLTTTIADLKQPVIQVTSVELESKGIVSPTRLGFDEQRQEPLGFLDLPFEIRSEIYLHLFESSKISYGASHTPPLSTDSKICSCQFPNQLIRTCRRIREEALPLLLSATTIEVNSSFDGISCLPQGYLDRAKRAVVLDTKAFSAQLAEASTALTLNSWVDLKVVELGDVTVWCRFYDEIFLRSPQADEPMATLALFNLKRINPFLLTWVIEPRHFNIHLFCRFVMNSLCDNTIYAVIDVQARKVLRRLKGPPMKTFNSWAYHW